MLKRVQQYVTKLITISFYDEFFGLVIHYCILTYFRCIQTLLYKKEPLGILITVLVFIFVRVQIFSLRSFLFSASLH